MEVIRRAHMQAPGPDGVRRTRWAIVRNTYGELRSTTIKTWRAWFDDSWGHFIQNPKPTHYVKRGPFPDGTSLECEVEFLAMDREEDARKFLSLEVTGIWFNEIKEIRRSLVEAGDGRLGRFPRMADGGPTWHGLIADTNMPDEDHWLYALAEVEKPEGWEFFKQPGGIIKQGAEWVGNPAAENLDSLVKGYYTAQLSGKTEAWLAVYLAAEYGRVPTEGAYYVEELTLAEREKRIGFFQPDPALPVHTFWDLGIADDTAIWFGQVQSGNWVWVDYYENSGKGLDHYAGYIKDLKAARKLTYGDHIWPHDGSARDWSADGAKRRCDVAETLGLKVKVLERSNLGDGIDAVRRMIRQSRFDAEHCKQGLKRLRGYRRSYNRVRGIFMDEPEHNENSHGSDAFRTAAMGQNKVSNVKMESNWKDVDTFYSKVKVA